MNNNTGPNCIRNSPKNFAAMPKEAARNKKKKKRKRWPWCEQSQYCAVINTKHKIQQETREKKKKINKRESKKIWEVKKKKKKIKTKINKSVDQHNDKEKAKSRILIFTKKHIFSLSKGEKSKVRKETK